jgi:hypothetical protein
MRDILVFGTGIFIPSNDSQIAMNLRTIQKVTGQALGSRGIDVPKPNLVAGHRRGKSSSVMKSFCLPSRHQ